MKKLLLLGFVFVFVLAAFALAKIPVDPEYYYVDSDGGQDIYEMGECAQKDYNNPSWYIVMGSDSCDGLYLKEWKVNSEGCTYSNEFCPGCDSGVCDTTLVKDTDGTDEFNKGKCHYYEGGSWQYHSDYCSGDTLYEYKENAASDDCITQAVSCAYGCEYGECFYATDTDGGVNYLDKGACTGINELGNQEDFYDNCDFSGEDPIFEEYYPDPEYYYQCEQIKFQCDSCVNGTCPECDGAYCPPPYPGY